MSLRIPQASAALVSREGLPTPPLNALFQDLKQALLLVGVATPGDTLIFLNQNQVIDAGQGPGMNALIGDVFAGPGSGTQVALVTTFAHTFLMMGG